MGLIEQLESRYRKEGYRTYSKHLRLLAASPKEWIGPLPDFLAKKNDDLVAVFLETFRSLEDPVTVRKWVQARQNPGTTLRLFVHNQAELELLRKTLKSESLPAEVALIEKKFHRVKSSRLSRRRLVRRIMVLLLVLSACYLIIWLASRIYDYSPQFYEPRDFERETTVSLLKFS